MKTKILIIITAVFFAVMLVLTFSSRSIHEAGLPHVKAGRLSEAEFPIEFTDENGELMTGTRQAPAVTKEQLETVKKYASIVNETLKEFFLEKGLKLIDFKIEFGLYDGEVILADEISPDTCRLWDVKTGEKMDKDRFRRDLGNVEETYAEVLKRVKND